MPGRPVLIDEADLENYLQKLKRTEAAIEAASTIGNPPRKRTPSEMESASVLAQRIFLARQNFQLDKQRKLGKKS